MKRIKIGLIGCGAIAESAHIPSLFALPSAKLIALCDINHARLRTVADRYNVYDSYSDHESLLRDSSIEAVVVCTPASTHAQIIIDCLEAGKHVFVEKPMTTALDDAKKVMSVVGKASVLLMVGYQLRFLPNQRKMKDIIFSGALGTPLYIHIRAETLVIKSSETILVDYMTHLFDLSRWYADAQKLIRVSGTVLRNANDTDFGAIVTEVFASGLTASIESFWVPKQSWASVKREVDVLGETGKVVTDISGPNILIYKSKSRLDRLLSPKKIMPKEGLLKNLPLSEYAYRAELQSFLNSIIESKPSTVNAYDGYAALKIAELARLSHEDNRSYEVEL